MANFIMLVGLPGCGKSTYAKNKYGSSVDTVILSSDAIREEFKAVPGTRHSEVFAEMNRRSKDALKVGKSVVYDATNLSRKHRMSVLQEFKKYYDRAVCVLFIESYKTCCERNSRRDLWAVVPEDRIFEMLKTFNVPMECEGFSKILVVNTSDDPDLTLDKYLEMSCGFNQENHHHSLDLYTHLYATRKNLTLYGNDVDPLLLDAALYHDIGKIWAKTYHNMNGELCSEAHYYMHENIGAYMYLVAVFNMSGSDRSHNQSVQDYLYVASLINWHMRPYLEMNEYKREREYEMLGARFVRDLKLLHLADERAH